MQFLASLSPHRLRAASCLAAAVAACAATSPADWWHRPWSDAYRAAPPPELSEPAAFLVVYHPNGYWVRSLPEASRFYTAVPMGIATGGVLRERMVNGLRQAPNHRVWTLGADVPMDVPVRESLAAQGYIPSAPCVRAASLWWVDTVFCRAEPAGERPLAAADLNEGDVVDFGRAGAGWIYEVDGWANAGELGTAAAGPSARLVFRPAPSQTPWMLELVADGASSRVAASVNGKASAVWEPSGDTRRRALCLPAAEDADIRFEGEGGRPLGLLLRTMRLRRQGAGDCGP